MDSRNGNCWRTGPAWRDEAEQQHVRMHGVYVCTCVCGARGRHGGDDEAEEQHEHTRAVERYRVASEFIQSATWRHAGEPYACIHAGEPLGSCALLSWKEGHLVSGQGVGAAKSVGGP